MENEELKRQAFQYIWNIFQGEEDREGTAEISKIPEEYRGSFEDTLKAFIPRAAQTDQWDQIPLLPKQQQELLASFQGKSQGTAQETILDCFARQVQSTPHHTALVYQDRGYSYEQVDAISSQLAWYLMEQGIGAGDVVSVLISRNEYMLLAPLGILKTGAAYQPLDATHPTERIQYMIEDSDAALLIVERELEGSLPMDSRNRKILYTDEISDLHGTPRPFPQIQPSDLFVLLYTSGSTGVPKGCMLEHGNILSFCQWYVDYYKVDSQCHMANHASFVFDVCMMELFMPLAAGATIYIIPEEIRTDLDGLAAYLERYQITHLSMTTQLGRQFILHEHCQSLRHLTVAGEALTAFPLPEGYQVHNGYGPTEGTILLTIQPVSRTYEHSVPIGRPLDGVDIYVLDAWQRQVPLGAVGELCASGPHITRGYLNQPEQTEQAYQIWHGKRIYHTGDMVRYHTDGTLEYLGRRDRQVKIRGFRIELTEIEAVLLSHPQVQDVTVTAWGTSDDKSLVAYYVAQQDIPEEELEAYIRNRKPAYMVPAFTIRVPAIPLNTNGKVDQGALPEPVLEEKQAAYEKPQTETERIFVRCFEEILHVRPIGRKDNFFRLGGHSLRGMKLLFQMERLFQRKWDFTTIIQNPTVESLAAAVDQDLTAIGREVRLTSVASPQSMYPLTMSQMAIYTADLVNGCEDYSYHLPMKIQIQGVLSQKRLELALARLILQEEVLRTAFVEQDGQIWQQIKNVDLEGALHLVDSAHQDITVKGTPFYLDQAPLLHWEYQEQPTGDSVIYLDIHHIISDGNSMPSLCRCLAENYVQEKPIPSIQYKEYAVWEQKQDFGEEGLLWKEKLSGADLSFAVQGDMPGHGEASRQGAVYHGTLSEEISTALQNYCKKKGMTEYIFLLSAYMLLLFRYTEHQDIVVGTPMTGRMLAQTENMQGMFVRTVPLLGQIEEDTTWHGFLEQIRKMVYFAYDHQLYHMEHLAAALGEERTVYGNLLFDYLFVMQRFDQTPLDFGGISGQITFLETGTAMYPLTMEVEELKSGYRIDIEYDQGIFSEDMIREMYHQYTTIVEHCAKQENLRLKQISLVNQSKQNDLIQLCSGDIIQVEEETVVDALLGQVQCRPEATAVEYKEETLTYTQLYLKAEQLAGEILPYVKKEDFVAILSVRNLEMVPSIWGVLMAGAAYVPVSPDYPVDRIEFILQDCHTKILLVNGADISESLQRFLQEKDIQVIDVQQSLQRTASMEKVVLPYPRPEQLAYMIYTSGTTGQPKGVMIEHRQLTHMLAAYQPIYQITEQDRVLQYANYVFDQSVWDIFHVLTRGGTLCIVPSDYAIDTERLEQYAEQKRISVASLTPGILSVLDPKWFRNLRLLDVGGEAPSEELLLTWWSPDREVLNTYGPTETTVNACSYTLDGVRRGILPIGKPIANTQIFILQGDQMTGLYVPGELCITGAGVARGYWNRDELNQEKFVENPFGAGKMYRTGDLGRYLPSGDIEFLGRVDDQVKLRGYRMELGEIGSQMERLPEIQKAVVVIQEDGAHQPVLCGYYTGVSQIHTETLLEQLQEYLPEYMIPAVLIYLEHMPLTVNGKIDKRALPLPEFTSHSQYERPEGEIESTIAQVWAEILGLKQVGRRDDFFQLGGDSIKAIRIVSKLRQAGICLEVRQLMRDKQVKRLAARWQQIRNGHQQEQQYMEQTGMIKATPVINTFIKSHLLVPAHYNQSVVVQFHEKVNQKALEHALCELIRHHSMLRLRWQNDSTVPIYVPEYTDEMGKHLLEVAEVNSLQEREAVCNRLQQSLSPRKGKMMAACLFQGIVQDQVLIVVHHLAVDEVSWNILLEDLQTAYQGAALPAHTTFFGQWSEQLHGYAESARVLGKRKYWQERLEETEASMERIRSCLCTVSTGKAAYIDRIHYLQKDVTKELQRVSREVWHTTIDVCFMAALQQAVQEMTGEKSLLLMREGHGRDGYPGSVSIDRTVGWFTTVYPVVIREQSSWQELLSYCKEMQLHVPDHGLGYGLLEQKGMLQCNPLFLLNYLGDEKEEDYGSFSRTVVSTGCEIAAENGEAGCIVWNIRVAGGKLEVAVTYDESCFTGDVIEHLEDRVEAGLCHIVSQYRDSNRIVTPSDLTALEVCSADWQQIQREYPVETIEGIYQLTPLQEGMLYHWVSDPASRLYFIQDVVTLRGEIHLDRLIESLEQLPASLDVLRMNYCYRGTEQIYQILCKEKKLPVQIVSRENWGQQMDRERDRGFDLSQDCLLRVSILPIDDRTVKLLLSSHHLVTDGWSFSVMLDALLQNYQLLCGGDELSQSRQGSYAEYLTWRQEQDFTQELEYWKQELDGYEEQAGIIPWTRTEQKVPIRDNGVYSLVLPQEEKESIDAFCRKNQITCSTFMEVGWALVLGWENNISDVVFGKTVSGRDVPVPDVEETVGLFINTIPCRVQYDKEQTVRQVLQEHQRRSEQDQSNSHIALPRIQRETTQGSQLIQTLFVLENYYTKAPDTQGEYTVQVESVQESTNYPITFSVEGEETLYLRILYDDTQYSEAQMEVLMQRIHVSLLQMIEGADRTLGDLFCMTEQDNRQMLVQCAGEVIDCPKRTVMEILQQWSQKQPQKRAVVMGNQELTYGQLYEQSKHLAHQLSRLLPQDQESIVTIQAERCPEMIVGIFGILMAGAAYVPLAEDYPEERIAYIAADCHPAAQMHIRDHQISIQGFGADSEITEERLDYTAQRMWNRLAYLIYTSGTTGQPKGVMIEHNSLTNMIYANQKVYGFQNEDCVLQLANFVFDQSVWDIFATIGCGGTLCLISREDMASAQGILQCCRTHQVTVLMTTTHMLGALVPEEWPELRMIDGGGDEASLEIFDRWAGKGRIFNSYGPTEITVNATAYAYAAQDKADSQGYVPIGRPLPNKQVYILQNEHLCGIGMKGEICIAGRGLARGYCNQEKLTQEKFVSVPWDPKERMYRTGDLGRYLPDGTIQFCGRIDQQVKIRGFRIELEEITHRMLEIPEIAQATVVTWKNARGEDYLCGYYVVDSTIAEKFTPEQVQNRLAEKLPDYMVPVQMLLLDRLPMNRSGKLDRHRLPKPQIQSAGQQNKQEIFSSRLEEKIAHVFERILSIESVGADSNFFALGGDSISAMKLASALGCYSLTVSDILRYPTPKQLAIHAASARLEQQLQEEGLLCLEEGNNSEGPSVYILPPTGGTLLCYQELCHQWIQSQNIQAIYGITDYKYAKYERETQEQLWEQISRLEKHPMDKAVEENWDKTVSYYEQIIQSHWQDGDILLGYSQGGSIGFVLAQRLESAGHIVGGLILLESAPYSSEEIQSAIETSWQREVVFSLLGGDTRSDSDTGKLWEETRELPTNRMLKTWVERWYQISQEEKDTYGKTLHLMCQTYLVSQMNTSRRLVAEGNVTCPVLDIHLDEEEEQTVTWRDYTEGTYREVSIQDKVYGHFAFLQAHEQRILQEIQTLINEKEKN